MITVDVATLKELPESVEPVFFDMKDSKGNKCIGFAGKHPDGYYYYSIAKENGGYCYFFKSETNNPKNAKLLSATQSIQLVNDIIAISDRRSYLVKVLYETIIMLNIDQKAEALSQSKREKSAKLLQEELQKQASFSHKKEHERKKDHRTALLNKYKDIAPVFLNDSATQICAKMNNDYIFINIDKKKPSFLKLSLKGSTPMTVIELMQFINFAGNSTRVGKTLETIAPYFKIFMDLKHKRPTPNYAITMYEKVQERLFRSLPQFDHIERHEISMRKEKKERQYPDR